ncbi:hypothetical protein [Oryzobacter terrae]|uniref:hypothetical protein n=1 Tax=Oryzobacter terrae TaxID=1620385 RepID=UPI00366D8C4D
MAAQLTSPPTPGSLQRGPASVARLVLLVASVGMLLVVGLVEPHAAQPDLAPRGWAPGVLLPVALSPAAVTALLWAAYVAGAGAVALGLSRRVGALRSWAVPAALGALALVTTPFGSADHVSYLAYGRILVTGGDPWTERPVDWGGGADPVTSRVEAPWTEEPSVYGPFGTLLHGLSALVGGDDLREGVWVWQLLVVLSWLAVRVLLRRVLPEDAHGRVDVLWTLNPLVLGVGVLGAHIDVVAAALVVAAVAVAGRWPGPVGALGSGVVAALAGSTKVTYAVVAVGLLVAWWVTGHRGAGWARLAGAHVAGVVVAGAALHVWAGPHVYDQLLRSRQAVSLAMPWRPLLEWGRDTIGNQPTRLAISIAAAVLAVVLAGCLLRLTRPARRDQAAPAVDPVPEGRLEKRSGTGVVALWVTACLALAYSLAAPYSLPWYDLLAWCALPALRAGPVDLLALVRLLALALAYVPGRVLGMTPGVEELTLGVRRGVVPWVGLALWAVVIAAGVRRGSWPWSAPGRRAS